MPVREVDNQEAQAWARAVEAWQAKAADVAAPVKQAARSGSAWRALGNVFIAAVVWGIGWYFTKTLLPFKDIGPWLPWGIAFVVQVALSIGQTNIRARGAHWPYLVLVLADIALNLIGLLMQFDLASTPQSAVLYTLRAITTGVNLWAVAGFALLAALIAALPEQLLRDR